jgi:Domain of unknown function (DUF4139)
VKTCTPLWLLAAFFAAGSFAQETSVTPTIESVGLFKNGLSVVRTSFEAKAPGAYVWTDPPRCVHGTFLVESDANISLRSGNRMIEENTERDRPTGGLQMDLAGQTVRVRLRGEKSGEAEITGRVWQIPTPPSPPRLWNTAIAGEGYEDSRNIDNLRPLPAVTTGNYLVIESDQKRVYVDIGQIASVEVAGAAPDRKRMVEKPVMIFNAAKAGVVRITYLTRGASWVPSYHVDLSDPKTLRLKQSALIRNELQSWKNAELQLISGFPNVRFGHVDSPLWPGTTLTNFFSQIARNPNLAAGAATQQIAYNSSRLAEAVVPELPADGSQSEDLHFESIGARDLSPGETLSLEVASGSAPYERVVEWTSPDTRSEYGHYQRNERQTEQEEAWDAILFQNPLKFSMTTAAATITEKGQFRGQTMSQWTNPGQRECLQITKALSVQVDRQEIEEQGKREQVSIGGYNYYRATVRGTLMMRNYRSQPTVILSRAQFSGELLAADEKPSDTLRRDGVFSINPRHELEWKLTLVPGAEKVLKFSYSVLVRN